MHVPVLLNPILDHLKNYKNLHIIDGTFGRGGYTKTFLNLGFHVTAFDRDPDSVIFAEKIKTDYPEHFEFIHDQFSNMGQISKKIDAVVLDLGVSSPQIDSPERGFSVRFDGPLDMRMSKDGISAYDLVNSLDQEALANIIFQYGEERDSRKIAHLIAKSRLISPIKTTLQLVEIIKKVNAHPKKALDSAIRTFQALRIYVNNELEELKQGLTSAGKMLTNEGLLIVVTFHSLEDRIVKNFIKSCTKKDESVSRYTPTGKEFNPTFREVIKHQSPSPDEINSNPRSRSAKLRIAERTSAPWREVAFS